MNEFEYQLNLTKIDSAKYVKDVRVLVYDYYELLACTYYSPYHTKGSTLYYNYKLFSKALEKFNNLSSVALPNKFDQLLEQSHRSMLEKISKDNTMNYEEVLDLFEYNTLVTLPYLSGQPFKNFCNIIGSNPLPFKLIIKVSPSALSTYKYFANLSYPAELTILTWMKSEGIPEDFTVAAQFRNDHRYINTQPNYQATLAERANLVLALEAIDQLTGGEVYE